MAGGEVGVEFGVEASGAVAAVGAEATPGRRIQQAQKYKVRMRIVYMSFMICME